MLSEPEITSPTHGRRKDFFQGGPKVVKFFSHWKLRKQPFFAEIFKIQVGAKVPPSDAHGPNPAGHLVLKPELGPKAKFTE